MKMPNLPSSYQAGTVKCSSDFQFGANGPFATAVSTRFRIAAVGVCAGVIIAPRPVLRRRAMSRGRLNMMRRIVGPKAGKSQQGSQSSLTLRLC